MEEVDRMIVCVRTALAWAIHGPLPIVCGATLARGAQDKEGNVQDISKRVYKRSLQHDHHNLAS